MRLRTISRNSWLVGTGWISFHVVFIVVCVPLSLLDFSLRDSTEDEEIPKFDLWVAELGRDIKDFLF